MRNLETGKKEKGNIKMTASRCIKEKNHFEQQYCSTLAPRACAEVTKFKKE